MGRDEACLSVHAAQGTESTQWKRAVGNCSIILVVDGVGGGGGDMAGGTSDPVPFIY